MLRMERDGLIELPVPQEKHYPKRRRSPRSLLGEPQAEIVKKAGELSLRFELVGRPRSSLWNELIDRYHYLGFTPLAGAQLRYFIESQYGTVALMSFSAADWKVRYNYRPVLAESFVQKDRFSGISYQAANWTCVGETQGRGKLDKNNRKALPIKTVWLYPLARDFRERLQAITP